MEATKNICGVMGESTVNHGTVTRWFKKFCSGCKNLTNKDKHKKEILLWTLTHVYISVG